MQGDKSADEEKVVAGGTELSQPGLSIYVDKPGSETSGNGSENASGKASDNASDQANGNVSDKASGNAGEDASNKEAGIANIAGTDLIDCPKLSENDNKGSPEFEHSAESNLVGTTIEQYKIVSVLGKGGMSVVYKAVHLFLHNAVAIKTMHAHLIFKQQALQRFKQEAQAATQLDHPNVIKVIGFGVISGDNPQPYIVMDYVEGRSLSDALLEKRRLSVPSTLKIFTQICNALSHAHSKGVIHRDLKPSNIMLLEKDGDPEFVKIVDFGLAKQISQEGEQAHRLTQTGEVFGSPTYMSPEQCQGHTVDKRSDVYAIGCVLYEALSGFPPHQGSNVFETFHKHILEIPPSLNIPDTESTLVDRLDAIVFRALEKDPDKRYQSMSKFENDLRSVQDNLDSGLRGADVRSQIARQRRSFLRFIRSTPRTAVLALFLATLLTASFCMLWSKFSWFFEPHKDFYIPESQWLAYLPPRFPKLHMSEGDKQSRLNSGSLALNHMRLSNAPGSPTWLRAWMERAMFCSMLNEPVEEDRALKTIIGVFKDNNKSDTNYLNATEQLAELVISQGDYAPAIPLLNDAKIIRERLSSSYSYYTAPVVSIRLGFVYSKLNDFEKAQKELSEAEKGLTHAPPGSSDELKEAEDSLAKGQKQAVSSDGRQLAILYAVKGDVFRLQRQWDQADKSFALAEQVCKESEFSESKRAGNFMSELNLLRAYVNLKAGHYNESCRNYALAVPNLQKLLHNQNDQIRAVLNDYALASWDNHDWLKALQLRNQAIDLSSTTARR